MPKDISNKSDTLSHIRHFRPSNELLHLMEELRHKNYWNMLEHDLKMYEDETTITFILFPIYQVRIVDTMLFFIDISVPHT